MVEGMQGLFEYIFAVLLQQWWLVVGALVAMIQFIEWLHKPFKITLRWKIYLCIFALTVAQFFAYLDIKEQREKLGQDYDSALRSFNDAKTQWGQDKSRLTAELQEKKPKFTAEVLQPFFLEKVNNTTDIYILMTVRNVGGSPSILDFFDLLIKHRDRSKNFVPNKGALIDPKETYRNKEGKVVYIFQRKDWLVEKALQPIQPGAQQIGYVRFIADVIRSDDIDHLTISFRDILQKRWYLSYNPSKGTSQQLLYYPGVDSPRPQ